MTWTILDYLAATPATALSCNLPSLLIFLFWPGTGIGGEYTAINSTIHALVPARVRGWVDLVINGSFCEQPPLGLIKSIERSGCYIVNDDSMLVTRWLLDDVPADANPLHQLPQAFLRRSASTAAAPPRTWAMRSSMCSLPIGRARWNPCP